MATAYVAALLFAGYETRRQRLAHTICRAFASRVSERAMSRHASLFQISRQVEGTCSSAFRSRQYHSNMWKTESGATTTRPLLWW